ncbi:MAG: ATPase [Tissierellia bacterium]|nr:ATPase [Tissierellia bacterium]
MDVLRLVDDLEDMLEVSNTVPLTRKVMVDKDEMLHILDQLRKQIPTDIAEAEGIKSREQEILEDAQYQAKQVVQSAHEEAKRLVDEDELVVLATEKAREMIEEAENESKEISLAARNYVDHLLEDTQVQLSELIKTLNQNRSELK